LGSEDVKYIENIISVKSRCHKLFLVFLDQVSQNDIDTCLTNNLSIFLCKNSLKSRKDIVHYLTRIMTIRFISKFAQSK
jgi:hypothetical protein